MRAAARAGVPRVVLTSSAASLGEAARARWAARPRRIAAATSRSTSAPSTRARSPPSRPRGEAGVELVSINPSSVQGPGRAGGTGRIMIAYLNGRLRAFVDTNISLVDIADCVEGHLLGRRARRARRALRAQRRDVECAEALDIVSELSGVRTPGALPSARHRREWPAGWSKAAFSLRGRQPPVCREMVRTLLHGHRYDGSRATRELGLRYTPGGRDIPAHHRVGGGRGPRARPDRLR